MNRSKNILFTLTYLLLFSTYVITAQESGSKPDLRNSGEEAADDTSNVQVIYQCQAHPQVLSNFEGRCPRCGNQLKEYTMEEAFANLSKSGVKKPDLSPKYVTKTVVEEEEVLGDSAATADSAGVLDSAELEAILEEYDFDTIDHDGNGMVYQCLKHPLEVEDEEGDCYQCGAPFSYVSIDEAISNIKNMKKTEEPESTEEAEGSAANNP
jgi:hypothetical protein